MVRDGSFLRNICIVARFAGFAYCLRLVLPRSPNFDTCDRAFGQDGSEPVCYTSMDAWRREAIRQNRAG